VHQIRFTAEAAPRTPLGELTALPRPPSWFKGNLLLRAGEGMGEVGKERGRGGEGRERRGKEGRGGREVEGRESRNTINSCVRP